VPDSGSMAKATLEVYDAKPATSGGADLGSQRDSIKFQFNPTELTLAKTAKWTAHTSRGAGKGGPPEFGGAEPQQMQLEMFLDETESRDGSVEDTVKKLMECCVPTSESESKKKPTPPLVLLRWGRITGFPGYLTAVSAKYVLFTPEGQGIRAKVSITIKEIASDTGRQNPTSGGLAVHRTHTLVEGDSLASVAWREYGDPTLWRLIAEENRIDDPMALRPGTTLRVPTAPATRESAPTRPAPVGSGR
jgi:nucleoid-associated protein YgaU